MQIIKNPNSSFNRPITISTLFWIVLVLILVAGNIFFSIKYSGEKQGLQLAQTEIAGQKTNGQILEFTKLFIDKVLKAETEVDFEMRLRLENAVRNLGDEEILNHWQSFIESQTEIQAQEEVKILLESLVNKIQVK